MRIHIQESSKQALCLRRAYVPKIAVYEIEMNEMEPAIEM